MVPDDPQTEPEATDKTDKLPEKPPAPPAPPAPPKNTTKPKAAPANKPAAKVNKELAEVVKRIDLCRSQGITSCSVRKELIEAEGVKAALIAKNYTVDRSEDPFNYQVGFGT